MKFELMTKHWVPSADYKFPKKSRNEHSRSFQIQWLRDFSSWLVYSAKCDGAFCKVCLLFRKSTAHNNQFGYLVDAPFQNWKKALDYFRNHEKIWYHQDALRAAEDFLKIYKNEIPRIPEMISAALSQKIQQNRLKLKSIVDTIIFCGQQNIALRGHREGNVRNIIASDEKDEVANNGNFRALLRFRVECGDHVLKNHFETAPKNAMYVSPKVQNDVIEIAGTVISEAIVAEVNESPYFSILADETTDIAGIEQMTFCVRYLKKDIITEAFLKFVPVHDTSGEALANTIIQTMKGLKLDTSKLRGQGYDGASNMSGKYKGVKTRISEQYPLAQYTHCCSHALNLVVMSSCDLKPIKNMIGTIK